jgi:hypothetical protein
MKSVIAVPHGLDDIECVADQLVDAVVVEVGRIGTRAGSNGSLIGASSHDAAGAPSGVRMTIGAPVL